MDYKKLLSSLLLFFSILSSFFSLAQNYITGQIISSKGIPIPYSSIYNLKRTHGVIADSGGFFLYDNTLIDSILYVSALGYKVQEFLVKDRSNLKIALKDSVININEVIVRKNSSFKINTLGIQSLKPDGKHSNCKKNNLELSLFINSNKATSNSYIDKAVFFITKDEFYDTPFRVKIYSNKAKIPDKLIIHDNIVVHAERPGWVVVDLKQYNIKVPAEGFHIAMEWLYSDAYLRGADGKTCLGQSLGMAKESNEILSCTRVNGDAWSLCLFYKLPNGDVYNPMIRVVINSYE